MFSDRECWLVLVDPTPPSSPTLLFSYTNINSFFIVSYDEENFKEPLWRSNNVWVRVLKQVSLQFRSKHWQRWSRCDVFRETVPDPRASRSKWVVSNSDQPWCQVDWSRLSLTPSFNYSRRRSTVVRTSVYNRRTFPGLLHDVQLTGNLLGVNRLLYVSQHGQLSHSSSWGQ